MYDAADTQEHMLYTCPHCQGQFDFDAGQARAEVFCPRCGKGFDPVKLETMRYPAGAPPATGDEDLSVGARLGQYRIDGLLGRGGMGAVYRATQTSLDRPVALKVLPRQMAEDPEFVTRFDREARALAELSHPNIVSIYDKGTSDGRYYFAMELVEGVSLREVIRSKKMKPAEALQLVPQLCEALEYAHAKGVIHRDIKPENILVDRGGKVKVADFGLARIVRGEGATASRGITQSNVVMGTFDYMAPEQRESAKDVDHRADIYSLGVVIYELLTGELPIGKFAPPSKKVQIDVRIDEVVMQLLEKEPGARFQRASDVSTRLEEIRTASPPVVPASWWLRTHPVVAAALAAAGILLLWLATRYQARASAAASLLDICGMLGLGLSAALVSISGGRVSWIRLPGATVLVGIGALVVAGFLGDALLPAAALGLGWMSVARGVFTFGGIIVWMGASGLASRITLEHPHGPRIGKWLAVINLMIFMGGAVLLRHLDPPSPQHVLEFMAAYSFVAVAPLGVVYIALTSDLRKPV